MRVTQGMLANNSLKYLSDSYSVLDKYMQQLDTGKKITRPSQDPVIAIKGIRYRTDLTQVEQFERNISEARGWMDGADDALDNANKALQRIRELTVKAANGTEGEAEREAIVNEIKQLTEHIAAIGNTKYGDKYIFNGTNTSVPPVTLDGDLLNTTTPNGEQVTIEISSGIMMPVNVDGNSVFGPETFEALNKIVETIENNGDITSMITVADKLATNVNDARTELGARSNRLDMVEDRVDSQKVIAKKIISDNEDAELEEVITNLKTQEAVHRAALGVSARVIQPTLLDFLR